MRHVALLLLLLAVPLPASEPAPPRHLTIGAEVSDDPTASPEKVDAWFQLLADNQMPLARVFIPRDEEQLRRMDWFFRAAERHHVGIVATLGGSPSPSNAAWIKEVVQRYKDSPALDTWILANEPTHAPEATEPAVAQFRVWLKGKYGSVERLNETWESHNASFDEITPVTRGRRNNSRPFNDWYTFWRTYLAGQLEWIAQQVRAVDSVHPTHTNPNGMIGNLASGSLDLPSWRRFLTTLGFTCHPSWHFGLLRRDQYTLGASYLAEVIRGSIEPKPFWVTELQGGVNTISANRPLYPFKEDIAQWLWTTFGAGADRVMFWELNSHSWGAESGEWSLLDLQNQPSERLETATKVARVINQHAALFDNSHAAESPITIILSLETMTQQEWAAQAWTVTSTEAGKTTRPPGRDRDAHVLAALAYFQTLSEMGIPARIKHIHDYDWETKSAERRLAILPNVAVLSREQADNIEAFVRHGNTVLITGLTGAWDPENRFWALSSKFPLENLLGATLRDIRLPEADDCQVLLQKPSLTLPSHLWVGEVRNYSAEIIGTQDGWITAVRKKAGGGEAIWIPSLVDVGAWLGDNAQLAQLLKEVTAPFLDQLPYRFEEQSKDCLMRVLRNGDSYVTVIANGAKRPAELQLKRPAKLSPRVLWGEGSEISKGDRVSLAPRGTLVLAWE